MLHAQPCSTPGHMPTVDILCVGPKPVQQRYSGVIRVQDVRATEIDKASRPAMQLPRARWMRERC